jgi:hypothetical protein
VLGAALAGPVAAEEPAPVWPEFPALSDRTVAYELDAVFDPDARTVAGAERIVWRNPSAEPVEILYLRLTPNAFAHGATTFHREAKGRFRRPFGTPGPDDWGWIDTSPVQVRPGGARLAPECVAPDDGNPDDCTVAALRLPAPVEPGATVELSLDFETRLPRPIARSGLVDGYALLAHWFPRVGRLDPAEGRWRIHQQHAATEFSADFATFDVTLETPDGWAAEGTGVAVATERDGGRTRRRFVARDAIDFALVLSRDLAVATDRYARPDGTGVDLVLRLPADRADRAPARLAAAAATLAALERRLGRYPYPHLVLVDPPRGAEETGAMEYPAMVTLGEGSPMPGRVLPPAVLLAHELAHQWFMAVLASDEAEEAWLDEGLATHVAGLVVDRDLGLSDRPALAVAGRALFELPWTYRWPDVARAGLHGDPGDPIHQPAWRFPGLEAYGLAVYLKADLVLSTGRGLAGEETWDRIVGVYARRHRFGHPTADDFLAVVGEEAGPELAALLSTLLLGDGIVDLSVEAVEVEDLRHRPAGAWPRADGSRELVRARSAEARADYGDRLAGGRYRTLVTVRRRGPPIPVPVRVRFADGSTADATWDGPGSVERLAFVRSVPAIRATVDPDRTIALDRNRADDTREVSPSRLAAVRWTAFALAALETALALAGGFP